MKPSTVVAMLATVALAGCLSGGDDADPDTGMDAQSLGVAPANCDQDRPAIAHHAGQEPAPPLASAPIPCLGKTGVNSREPSIAITSDGTIIHAPAMDASNVGAMGVSVSHDEGLTWEHRYPNIAGVPTHPVSLDPTMYLDPATDRILYEDLYTPMCAVMSRSDDAGESWISTPLGGCLVTDHQWTTAAPPISSTTVGYPNVFYRCSIHLIALAGSAITHACQRSLDGGLTWLPPGTSPYTHLPNGVPGGCAGGLGHVKSGLDGRVYLPKIYCDQPHLAWSDDEALTWTVVQVSGLGATDSGGLTAHDGAVAIDRAGTVYYLWIAADRLPYLAVSYDGGSEWNEPLMIAAPGVGETSQPEIIAGDDGRIAFVYMGSENSPGAPFDGDYSEVVWTAYMGLSHDADSSNPTFYSVAMTDPGIDPFVVGECGAVRCAGVQDFLDIRIAPDGTPWAALIDDCLNTDTEPLVCDEDPDEPFDTHREGVVGRLWGAPSLWPADDPNGDYPDA